VPRGDQVKDAAEEEIANEGAHVPTQSPQLSPHDLSPYSSHIIARRLTPIPNQRLRDAEIDDVLMKALTVIGGIATQPRAVSPAAVIEPPMFGILEPATGG
jgi:hypothetical protein